MRFKQAQSLLFYISFSISCFSTGLSLKTTPFCLLCHGDWLIFLESRKFFPRKSSRWITSVLHLFFKLTTFENNLCHHFRGFQINKLKEKPRDSQMLHSNVKSRSRRKWRIWSAKKPDLPPTQANVFKTIRFRCVNDRWTLIVFKTFYLWQPSQNDAVRGERQPYRTR